MKTVSENRCFGGTQGVYTHASEATQCDMTFGLFLPEEAQDGPVPVLWYLSGLTCTHENAMVKAGAQAWAAEQGLALVFPDTDLIGAYAACERLRSTIQSSEISAGANKIRLTVSIGLTNICNSVNAAAALLKRADELLYVAKNSGRNQVMAEGGLMVPSKAKNTSSMET